MATGSQMANRQRLSIALGQKIGEFRVVYKPGNLHHTFAMLNSRIRFLPLGLP